MGYLSQPALKNLKKYSYKGLDESLVSRYVLTPYWNWFIQLWPTTVAPNTITFLGLCIVLFNLATMVYYDPLYLTDKDAPDAGPPQWMYYTWAVGLFMYQSFDAVDGKQARRTGMAGPLGEMFDHGCDAINTTLECVLACRALNLGRSWWTVASQVATLANFYLTTWEEYHTGLLYLGPFSGPVEGILMIVVVYIITGLFGPSFWDTGILTFTRLDKIPLIASNIPNIGLNEAFMVFGALSLGFNILGSYANVRKANLTSGKSNSRALAYLGPFAISAALQAAWLASPTPAESAIIYSPVFLPFVCAWGLQFAHQVGKIILGHVTKGAFPVWDVMWVWSAVGVVDAHLPTLLGRPPVIQADAQRTAIFVWLTFAVSFVSYVRFCTLVINDITEYLGIACFTVRKKDAEGHWADARKVEKTQ
ncbi:choline ethanolaminephosphotransferase [Coniophora puteana RWD-64-598 SS2]|uniref:diacylglycerol cholinephosphotransferase n=1 Tax=Coniophora puteana (strain RWD-64-598) TaxID=741705 RepID=A0A5M3N7C9_CONPW|nr:choline ethanolaminephosphotransferase [Coniophora puteana RWD-64-598 SS2]EIW87360.1 choline ethanolaminephosphotransferase [Coniophora puteana RWD-64-598 SS2]